MLQRSQTLILLGVFILSLLMLTGPLSRYTMDGAELILKHSGLFDADGEKMALVAWPMTVLFTTVVVLTFMNIFFYRHRMRQMRIATFLILLNAGMIGMMFFYTFVAGNQLEDPLTMHQWRFVLPPINMILLYFAFRRIRRDELLVKAFDRIR